MSCAARSSRCRRTGAWWCTAARGSALTSRCASLKQHGYTNVANITGGWVSIEAEGGFAVEKG